MICRKIWIGFLFYVASVAVPSPSCPCCLEACTHSSSFFSSLFFCFVFNSSFFVCYYLLNIALMLLSGFSWSPKGSIMERGPELFCILLIVILKFIALLSLLLSWKWKWKNTITGISNIYMYKIWKIFQYLPIVLPIVLLYINLYLYLLL